MSIKVATWLETSFIDWDGNITAVLFTPGCNFRCPFCHNHEIVFYKGEGAPLEEVLESLEKYKEWLDGIVISGGEPTIHEMLPDAIKMIKEKGWKVKLDTNGSNPEMIELLLKEQLVDYIAMDIKTSFDKYEKVTGVKVNKEAILRSIKILLPLEGKVEFRTTVVPHAVSAEDIREIRKIIGSRAKYVLQAFSPENTSNPFFKNLKPYKACEVRLWDKNAILRGFKD
ncbi:MAG: anaerobic ribonucleoside-triphosphate reductase activating protein [Synergistetes bacterium]|nr:anaerobic ribonucleoside-triphosphate reductase activating protein [Synergistota bacterium]MCX8128138.1 anaerobic ribonucleoside-triphosphate reductase activating protein [Synergistota bacterium]MDW8192514.1 anaerobic ribonucleoside-triphosphate reductase activating protein [Synergistota bacterium]